MDFRLGNQFDFAHAAAFMAGSSTAIDDVPLPAARCSTSTSPPARSTGVEVARLGKRIYQDGSS